MSFQFDTRTLDKLTERVTKSAMDATRNAAASSRCPDHHKGREIMITNTMTGDFAMTPCCDKVDWAARDAIARKLRSRKGPRRA